MGFLSLEEELERFEPTLAAQEEALDLFYGKPSRSSCMFMRMGKAVD